MNTSQSLLTRQQSTWLKGILILLIVLGHNGILMGKYPGLQKIALNGYLYSFHVYAFFFVTSLYNWQPISWEGVKKNFFKLYKPYGVLFIVLLCVNYAINHKFIGGGIILAFINGSGPLLEDAIGMSFPWFLTSMFSFLVIRDLYAKTNKSVKLIILAICLAMLFLPILGVIGYSQEIYSICGSQTAMRVFALCFICRWFFEKYNSKMLYKVIIVFGSIAVSAIYFLTYKENKYLTSCLTYGLVPFFMFQFIGLMAYNVTRFSKIILYLGNHSFDIYIVHLLVCNAICIGLQHFNIQPTIYIGIAVYLITLLITIVANYILGVICPPVYKFLYSKDPK